MTFVLAGGRGNRLSPLTHHRSKPAVPFGDCRIIDFALTNCLRSQIEHPLIITQYKAAHLTEHTGRWWLRQSASTANSAAAPVCVPAPRENYVGTADAIYRNLIALQPETKYVLVLSADHIYDMDYRELLRFHAHHDADATLAAVVCPSRQGKQFGVLEIDGAGRIFGFEEKPMRPKELPQRPGKILANMGVYVFRKEALQEALTRDAMNQESSRDIGKSILPKFVVDRKAYAFRFEDPETAQPRYWRDVGTIESYHEASMEWLRRLPKTHRLAGSSSVISEEVRIHRTAEVVDSVLMSGVIIGAGARIRRAVLDENVKVMAGAQIGCGPAEGIVAVPANSTVFAETSSLSLGRLEPVLDQLRHFV